MEEGGGAVELVSRMQVSGFGVRDFTLIYYEGLGVRLRLEGLGFRVIEGHASRFRGLGIRVWGLGIRVGSSCPASMCGVWG